VRQPQVMLEAFLVSLNDAQSLDFGVELERLRVSGETFIKLSSLFGLSTAGSGGGVRNVPDRTGFAGSVLNPGEFSIILRAVEGVSKGRSLSSPKVLVGNNQQATFNSVLQQPFASTNASNTVATTAFGGTQDAGTTISVQPQIAEGDHLVLTYSVSLSAFVGAATNPNLPPPRQQNSVSSVSTIPDGYTVVVGGLETTTEGDSETKVPVVGSIPLVGELFKNRSRTSGRTRFFVFLRASVLRGVELEELRHLSINDAEAARLGPPDGAPEVQPRIVR
jgi:general secretion pathway protein D